MLWIWKGENFSGFRAAADVFILSERKSSWDIKLVGRLGMLGVRENWTRRWGCSEWGLMRNLAEVHGAAGNSCMT